ncbi:MAG: hypothetical protein RL295_737, partial [Pseudomonadota bacterium]
FDGGLPQGADFELRQRFFHAKASRFGFYLEDQRGYAASQRGEADGLVGQQQAHALQGGQQGQGFIVHKEFSGEGRCRGTKLPGNVKSTQQRLQYKQWPHP